MPYPVESRSGTTASYYRLPGGIRSTNENDPLGVADCRQPRTGAVSGYRRAIDLKLILTGESTPNAQIIDAPPRGVRPTSDVRRCM